MANINGEKSLFCHVGSYFPYLPGHARLSNVEFKYMGQEGYIDYYDPRYSLAYLNTGTVSDIRPSYVSNCSFHHGFAPAVGIFGSNQIEVTHNVVYKTVWSGKKFAFP